jgi:phage recombination protein Bet
MAQAQTKAQTPAKAAQSQGEVAVFQPPRLPFHPAIEEKFGVSKTQWPALVDAVFPAAKSVDAVVLALSYCKARNLDPFKKMVHIVPVWNSQLGREVEGVWPGIGEHRATATRTGRYAGCDATEFGPEQEQAFTGRVKSKDGWEEKSVTVTFPEWARVTVYKIVLGHRVAFVGPKVYWLANYGRRGRSDLPNEKWERSPHYMIEKVAEAAALRRAFPEELGDEPTAEEMEGRIVDVTPANTMGGHPADPPTRPTREQFRTEASQVTDVEPAPAEAATIEGEAQDSGAAAETVGDWEAVLDDLTEQLSVTQADTDIEEVIEANAERIGYLPAALLERWEAAVAKRRDALKKAVRK